MRDKVAVIDTGTNSTRLIIARATEQGLVQLERRTEITRLGEGVAATGRLEEEARLRVERCVRRYRALVDHHGVTNTLLVATSSVRDAADGPDFISLLAAGNSYDHRVLSGEEEARLSFRGALLGKVGSGRMLLFDIGGGSTEIVTGTEAGIDFSRSLQLGCVRLKELFLAEDPPSAASIREADAFARGRIKKAIEDADASGISRALAVAGTMTTLAALDLGLKSYDTDAVDGHILTRVAIDSLFARLACMKLEEKRRISVIEEGRADVLTAGALIASVVMDEGGFEETTISETDLLDGAALAFAMEEI